MKVLLNSFHLNGHTLGFLPMDCLCDMSLTLEVMEQLHSRNNRGDAYSFRKIIVSSLKIIVSSLNSF